MSESSWTPFSKFRHKDHQRNVFIIKHWACETYWAKESTSRTHSQWWLTRGELVKNAYKVIGAGVGHEVVFKAEFYKYDLYKFWSGFADQVSGIVSGLIFGTYEPCGSTLKAV